MSLLKPNAAVMDLYDKTLKLLKLQQTIENTSNQTSIEEQINYFQKQKDNLKEREKQIKANIALLIGALPKEELEKISEIIDAALLNRAAQKEEFNTTQISLKRMSLDEAVHKEEQYKNSDESFVSIDMLFT